MLRRLPALAVLALLAGLPAAAADPDDPAAYLAEARKRHRDLAAHGIRSFTARFALVRSEDESLRAAKDLAGFGYAFEAPDRETFDFEGTHPNLQKPLRDALRGLWRDLTGTLWLDLLDKATDVRLERGELLHVVSGTVGEAGECRLVFDASTGRLSAVEFVKAEARAVYVLEDTEEGVRPSARDVTVKEKWYLRLTFRAYRDVSGFELPTVVGLATEKNATEFAVIWATVNGEPARVREPDADEVKALVAAFEKGWRGWSEVERAREMRVLADVPDDRTAAAIARLGLRDPSPLVREEAAAILGALGRTHVVPPLIAALKPNEKDIRVYLRLIAALGDLGDPRAVESLSKDWWNQRIGEYGVAAAKAKIRALGKIRHVASVDALLDTFTLMKDETISRFKDDLVASLRGLTGKDFGYDRDAWREWWKRNRASHRFE